DLRIILHKHDGATLLAYVGHHDDAYAWAERKRLVPHERTGAMQFVEVPVVAGAAYEHAAPQPAMQPSTREQGAPSFPFEELTDDQLLDVGVPRDWLQPVRETQEADLSDLLD